MPGLTDSRYTKAYIQGEDLLLRRDIYKYIHNRYREGEGLADLLLQLGRKKKTANTLFNHWEHDYLINSVTIDSISVPSAGAGTAITIVIDAASHQEGGNNSPFLVNDLVMIGQMRGKVTAVDKSTPGAHEYTLTPIDNTEDWAVDANPVPGVGIIVTWYGNAFADGTFGPDSSVRKPLLYQGYTQIHKTKFETHASVAADEAEVKVGGKYFYYRQGVEDALERHMLSLEYMTLLGQVAVGLQDTTAPDGPGDVNTSYGLEKETEARGTLQPYAAWAYAEFETVTKTLDTERAPLEYMGLFGTHAHLDNENVLHGRNLDTGIQYALFGKGNAKKAAVDFGFLSFAMGGRTIHIKKWDALNYKPITGFNGSPYKEQSYWIPNDKFRNPKGKGTTDSICLRYKENDIENRFMKEYRRGPEITDKDAYEWSHRSEVGLQLAMVNQYIKCQKL